jgi:hypothetical protein
MGYMTSHTSVDLVMVMIRTCCMADLNAAGCNTESPTIRTYTFDYLAVRRWSTHWMEGWLTASSMMKALNSSRPFVDYDYGRCVYLRMSRIFPCLQSIYAYALFAPDRRSQALARVEASIMMAVRLETPVEYKAGISYWRRPPTVHEPAHMRCLGLGESVSIQIEL